jgi:hypothetical protein
MMIVKSDTTSAQTRRFLVNRANDRGWDVREEHDTTVVARAHYADWHRVERARQRFEWGTPATDGWTEDRTSAGA